MGDKAEELQQAKSPEADFRGKGIYWQRFFFVRK